MKTKVELLFDSPYDQARKGDVGYIDGWVRGANDKAYAVVVIRDFICFVPHRDLKVISLETI